MAPSNTATDPYAEFMAVNRPGNYFLSLMDLGLIEEEAQSGLTQVINDAHRCEGVAWPGTHLQVHVHQLVVVVVHNAEVMEQVGAVDPHGVRGQASLAPTAPHPSPLLLLGQPHLESWSKALKFLPYTAGLH